MLESTFKLVFHWLWSLFGILYTLYPVSQLEWPIIMTKQLLIMSDAHIGFSDQSEGEVG